MPSFVGGLSHMIEEALDALENAIALSEARQESPADNVTKRVAELYRRIQRSHSRCQRLSMGASEIRSTCGSEATGVLQSISLGDDLAASMLRESELKAARSTRAATAISSRASRPSRPSSSRPTPAPVVDSHSDDDDSDGDLVASTYAGVLAPNQLGPMASEHTCPMPPCTMHGRPYAKATAKTARRLPRFYVALSAWSAWSA